MINFSLLFFKIRCAILAFRLARYPKSICSSKQLISYAIWQAYYDGKSEARYGKKIPSSLRDAEDFQNESVDLLYDSLYERGLFLDRILLP